MSQFNKGDPVIISRKIHKRFKEQSDRTTEGEGVFHSYSGSARAWVLVSTRMGLERKSFPLVNLRLKGSE
jgi:hypothetical protein